MNIETETLALSRIQANVQQHGLRAQARQRAEELRQARPRLHFSDCRKSLPRLHAEDAGAGLDDKPYLPRRLG